jgi:hypothetical protein
MHVKSMQILGKQLAGTLSSVCKVATLYECVLITSILVDSSIEPTAYEYENIFWYPGMDVVERRKQAYLDSHPHIRAHDIPPQATQ